MRRNGKPSRRRREEQTSRRSHLPPAKWVKLGWRLDTVYISKPKRLAGAAGGRDRGNAEGRMKKAHAYHPAKTRTGAWRLMSGVAAGRRAETGPARLVRQEDR